MTFGQKHFQAKAPDKGSFPLDHEGECKSFMVKYMACLRENQMQNTKCRTESKEYLECRMNANLMVREDWSKLGFKEWNEKLKEHRQKQAAAAAAATEGE